MVCSTLPAPSVRSPVSVRHRALQAAVVALYAFATLQAIRFYTVTTFFYLSLPAYLSGHERMPFQKRILPALIINGFHKIPLYHRIALHPEGAFTADRAPIYVIALLSILVAGFYTQRLYGLLTTTNALYFLVYPILLFSLLWAYAMHMEANFSYPYDMPSVAFFSAGLYYVYTRRFLPFLLVIFLGTFNRETTLFLIGIYFVDALSTAFSRESRSLRLTVRLRALPWWRLTLVLAIWCAIETLLSHIFAHNSRAEDYVRIRENFGRLRLRLVPALLNICGYLLPIVLLLQASIRPHRFRSYLLIVPVWVGVMFYTGVILETRIYGELCPYVAIALVLIMERHVTGRNSSLNSVSSLPAVRTATVHS